MNLTHSSTVLIVTVLCFVQYFPDLSRPKEAPPDLLGSIGEEWSTARHTLSPSFSASKMRAVSEHSHTLANSYSVFVDVTSTGREC